MHGLQQFQLLETSMNPTLPLRVKFFTLACFDGNKLSSRKVSNTAKVLSAFGKSIKDIET